MKYGFEGITVVNVKFIRDEVSMLAYNVWRGVTLRFSDDAKIFNCKREDYERRGKTNMDIYCYN